MTATSQPCRAADPPSVAASDRPRTGRPARPAPGSGATRSTTTLGRLGPARTIPRRPRPRSCGCTTTSRRPTPTGFVVGRAAAADRADRRPSSRSPLVVPARAPVVPVDAVRAARRPGAGARPGAARAGHAAARTTATARGDRTDSVQPISNALYASLGIVPRMPLVRLVGLAERPTRFRPLPPAIDAVAFDAVAGDRDGRGGRRDLDDELDRDSTGSRRASRIPSTTGYVRAEGRTGFLFRGPRRRRRSATATRRGRPGRPDRGSRRGAARPGRSAT